MAKKYYWLKLKNDFFKRHDIRIIEDMPNGKDYVLFYLKLLVESVSHEGDLRFSDTVPYNESMLATITNTNIDVVRTAIKVFTDLNLMDMLDDGTIYMNEVNKMFGEETEWAKKKREYRENKKKLQLGNANGQEKTMSDKSLEKELDLELDLEKELKESIVDQIQIDDLPSEPKPKSETVQLFEYYLEVELVNHKKLTDSMKKSAKLAFKDYSLIELKEMLDRHKQVVDITKSEKQYSVKKRTFAEFFGQKVKDAKILICEEYADDGPKWSHYKGVIESGTARKQQDNAIANAVQGITRKQHNFTTEGDDKLL